jgi:hypothetical protein
LHKTPYRPNALGWRELPALWAELTVPAEAKVVMTQEAATG